MNDELVFNALALSSVVNQTYTRNHPIDDLILPEATGGSGTLTYTLLPQTGTLAEALPGLRFTAGTRILSGTPTTATTQAVTLVYKVNDTNGAAVETTFTVTVNDELVFNELALSSVVNQTYTRNHPIDNLILPEAMGGSGTLTYTLLPQTGTLAEALPDLLFTASTRILSGTPTAKTTGAVTLTYKVTDTNGATAETTFTVTVNDGLALGSVNNQTYTKDHTIDNLVLPQATGGSGTLTYTLLPETGTLATALPGLSFTASTRTLSGTPNAVKAATTLTYRVNDTNGATAETTFTVTVSDGLALGSVNNQTYTKDHTIDNLVLPQATGGSGTLTYTLLPETGTLTTALPGLSFTASTRTLFGTPNAAKAATMLTYKVTDTNGAIAETTFTVTVSDGLALGSVNNQTYTKDHTIDNLVLPQATGGSGTLTYTLLPETGTLTTALPGLSFTASTRTLSGTPNAVKAATTLTYRVNDTNGAAVETTFTVTVSDGLALGSVNNQTYTKGSCNRQLGSTSSHWGQRHPDLHTTTGDRHAGNGIAGFEFHCQHTYPFRHPECSKGSHHADLQGK